ncbi:hypothetical protein KKG18_00380, partial [Patescibacteria group bacterium]|nr:hypothetical protein [Patescibacteria group bacterium]
VALSADTAAAGNIPAGSPNEFVTINLTASNDGDVNITSITLTASGLGDAINIKNVTIYDGAMKQGTSKNANSDRIATINFSSPIVIAAGTTKTLTVKATILIGQTGNFVLGINSASGITTNGATVSGSFPVQGNTQSSVTGVTIGTVIMSNVGTTATAPNFGEDNVLLASFDLAVANEAVIWQSFRLRNGGTNDNNIVSNVRLLIDGDEVVSGASLVDKYIDFDMNDQLIAKNDTISVEVYGDIGIANVGNTIDLYIYNQSDAVFVGQSYGYGIEITSIGALDAAGDGAVATLATGDFTLDMDKTATPAKDVRAGDNDVVLATIRMTSNGENATISQIADSGTNDFEITGTGLTTGEIENVELKDVDTGVVYDITETFDTNKWTLSMTEEIVLVNGVTKTFELRADLAGPNDATPIDNTDDLKVTLDGAAMSITGDVSNASITNITPSSVTGAIATVKAASLTWTTTTLTNKTVVPGAEGVTVYKATLKAGASSYVNLTSVKIDVKADLGLAFVDNNITKLDLYLDGKLVKSQSNAITENATPANSYVSFTSLDTTNRRIVAGDTVDLELKASFASSFSTTGLWNLLIEHATDSIVAKDQDNNNVAESIASITASSRDVTLAGVGTLMAEVKTDDLKADTDTYLLAGSETTVGRYLGELEFTTANESITVKTLVLGQAGTATDSDISKVRLYDVNGVMVAEEIPSADGYANFDTLNLVLPADQTTSYFIGVVSKSMNADGDSAGTATFNRTVQLNLASTAELATLGLAADKSVTAQGVDSGEEITIVEELGGTLDAGEYSLPTVLSKTANISGSVLNSVVNAMSNATLTGGNGKTIGKYTFTFDNGANRTSSNAELKAELNTLVLAVATSTGVTVSNVQAYIDGASAIKTTAVAATSGSATIDLTSLSGTTELVDGAVTLVIVADLAVTGSDQYAQTEINDLVGTGDFTYNGDNGVSATNYSDVRLDIAEVTGATLSN